MYARVRVARASYKGNLGGWEALCPTAVHVSRSVQSHRAGVCMTSSRVSFTMKPDPPKPQWVLRSAAVWRQLPSRQTASKRCRCSAAPSKRGVSTRSHFLRTPSSPPLHLCDGRPVRSGECVAGGRSGGDGSSHTLVGRPTEVNVEDDIYRCRRPVAVLLSCGPVGLSSSAHPASCRVVLAFQICEVVRQRG